MGVSISLLSERKPSVPCVVGVGTPILFQEAELFPYMRYVMGVATPTPFKKNNYEKCLCGHTKKAQAGICTVKTVGAWTST